MTTLAEEIYLRALTGRLVGEDLLASYNKVAIVGMKNMICAAMGAAVEASFISQTGGRAKHFIIENGNERDVADQLREYDSDAILLLFDGESPENAKKLFSSLLGEVASYNIMADIIIHVRIFTVGGIEEAIKNEDVLQYLQKRNVYVYTFDLDKGMMLIHEVEFEDGITLHKIAELPITCEHADLLNRSLRNKKISWEEE